MKKLAALLAVLFVASTLSYATVKVSTTEVGAAKTKVVRVKRVKKTVKTVKSVKVDDKSVVPVKK